MSFSTIYVVPLMKKNSCPIVKQTNVLCSLKNLNTTTTASANFKQLFLPVTVVVTGKNDSTVELLELLYIYQYTHRLYPISEEDNLPKALLPVGNKPVISYTLEWLEKAGIHGNLATVVVAIATLLISLLVYRCYCRDSGDRKCTSKIISLP